MSRSFAARIFIGLGFACLCLMIYGCETIPVPPDEGKKWEESVAANIGSPYSDWAVANRVQEKTALLVNFPKDWTAEEWRIKYLKYAKRFQGYRDANYLYERDVGANWSKGTGKWMLRAGMPPSYEDWVAAISTRRMFQKNIGEGKARTLLEKGELQAHYIPVRRGRDPIIYHADYLVVFTTNNTIVGYGESSFGKKELDYIKKEFGFVP